MLIAAVISLILLIAGYIFTRFVANRQQKNNDYEIMTSPSRGSRVLAHVFYFFGLFFLVVLVLFYVLPTKRNGTEIAFLFVGDLVAGLSLLLVFVIYVQFEAIKGDTVYIKRFIKVREIKIADITSADLTGLGYVIITKNGGGFTMSAGTLRSAELVEKIKERKEGKLFSINPDIPSTKEEEGAEKEETALAKIGKDFRNMVPKLKKNGLITFLVNIIATVLLGVACFVAVITLFDEGYLRSLCLAVFVVAALWELIYVFSFFKGQSNLTKDLEHDDEWLGNKYRFVSLSVKGAAKLRYKRALTSCIIIASTFGFVAALTGLISGFQKMPIPESDMVLVSGELEYVRYANRDIVIALNNDPVEYRINSIYTREVDWSFEIETAAGDHVEALVYTKKDPVPFTYGDKTAWTHIYSLTIDSKTYFSYEGYVKANGRNADLGMFFCYGFSACTAVSLIGIPLSYSKYKTQSKQETIEI